jgi:hypothetical protein
VQGWIYYLLFFVGLFGGAILFQRSRMVVELR